MFSCSRIVTSLRSPQLSRQGSRCLSMATSRLGGADEKSSFQSMTALAAAAGFLAISATGINSTELEPEKKGSIFKFWKRGGGSSAPRGVKKLAAHPDVSVWKKGDRVIFILAAKNFSKLSADLATNLVRDVHPEAVFVDITEHVFVDYGIYDRCKKAAEEAGIPKENRLNLRTDDEIDEKLPDVPKQKGAKTGFFSLDSADAVENAITGVFKKLKYAGLDENEEKAETGAHFVNAISEGHKYDARIILGGRSHQVTKDRGDKAIANTAPSAATTPLDLEWRPDETDRENYRRVAAEMKRVFPPFHQVMVEELDQHMAKKLNNLESFKSVVALVMMLHADGVEENLKAAGWTQG